MPGAKMGSKDHEASRIKKDGAFLLEPYGINILVKTSIRIPVLSDNKKKIRQQFLVAA